jgi:oxygen-independent coproporphyrinogen-3 oxidase
MLLYIHIPFCDSKCHYCSFNSYVDLFPLRSDYMKALEIQLASELHRFGVQEQSIDTVFIGGGTPSTVTPEQYAPLFEKLSPYLKNGAEITSEANPNSATLPWMEGMRSLGVNRVSFGVQSFDDAKLGRLGRAHRGDEAVRALLRAKAAGFEHISLDLIYGVAGDTQQLLEEDLDRAFSLPVDHLSAYALTIEEGTPFASSPEMADEKLALTRQLFAQIEAHGFEQYEISNFGVYRSRHNLGYWRYEDYIGLGSGAVGFHKDTRFYPTRDVRVYIRDPLAMQSEHLDPGAIKTEKLFLGMRSAVGVDKSILTPEETTRCELLVSEEKLEFCNGRFYNSDFLLSDELVLFIEQ